MTEERKNEIEKYAKEYGYSFATAKWILDNEENDEDFDDIMREVWY